MKIFDLFTKQLDRSINGVVKADQQDDGIVWQELDEYVVTRELQRHFRQVIDAYLAGIDNPKDPVIASKMAVWISGFFGSGKSHFIKILSYLLSNRKAKNPENQEKKLAADFFTDKVEDHMLLGDINRSVQGSADVILFNIDSKADSGESRDVLLMVFLRVFNEMLGFSGDHPHLAELERYLTHKGKYSQFQEAFKAASGLEWTDERDAYQLHRDETVSALTTALGMSAESAEKWLDGTDRKFKLNIESLADKVKEYLDAKGPDHRVVFLVDEVGQFVGDSQPLMLNLQTIAEELGTKCQGRAWVMVTSQEDIDSVVGECNRTKAQDFSKIQGRFSTRLSLSSSNTDEVIQIRLLEKTEAAHRELAALYKTKADIIHNQLRFDATGPTLKGYEGEDQFACAYPFAPYQFDLLQDVFESIRQAGATGKHLSRGERSLLDAFQLAALRNKDREVGALVPLYDFYPCIESFLDTSVKLAIDKAADIPGITDADLNLLKTLFLIRYTEKLITGTVENLVTLFIDEVDADRLAVRSSIEESLAKLEKEHLISRHGDKYFFLTNEEQDVSREIKAVDVSNSEETQLLCEWMFDEVLKGKKQHRFTANNKDYGFNRICDGAPRGNTTNELTVEIVTPLHPEIGRFNQSTTCVMHSSDGGPHKGHLLFKLPDHPELGRELRFFKQTEKYIQKKSDASAPQSLKNILARRAEQNRDAKARILSLLGELIVDAEAYALGQTLTDLPGGTASSRLEAGLDYLITNLYSKLGLLKHAGSNPQAEVQAVLKSDDVAQPKLLTLPEANPEAIQEMQRDLDIMLSKGRVLLEDVVKRFSRRPYGWPEWEVVLMAARLFKAEVISFVHEGSQLTAKDASEYLGKTRQWPKVSIQKRRKHSEEQLEKARKLGQELFGTIGPEGEDALCESLRMKVGEWLQGLKENKARADTGRYPGTTELAGGIELLEELHSTLNSYGFLTVFLGKADALRDLEEDIHELEDFYKNQRPTWDRLLKALDEYAPNASVLSEDADASVAFQRMQAIREMPAPYGAIKDIDSLISAVDKVNAASLKQHRADSVSKVNAVHAQFLKELTDAEAKAEDTERILRPLEALRQKIGASTSIPAIEYCLTQELSRAESAVSGEVVAFVEASGKDKGETNTAKQVLTLRPASVCKKAYIESESDVKEFVDKLESELLTAVKKNHRIRIQ